MDARTLSRAAAVSRPIRTRGGLPEGATLIELLAVVAIVGALVGLLLPAVQAARDASRRASCADNLRNLGVALHHFHDAHGTLPFGRETREDLDHAWSSAVLPFLEEGPLAAQIDYGRPWNDPLSNARVATQNVAVYRCPSSATRFGGQIDYGGILGSSLTGLPWGFGSKEAFGSGCLIGRSLAQPHPVRFASVTDGMSHTLMVGEAADLEEESPAGMWASGLNCFAVEDAVSHKSSAHGLSSLHQGGAYGLLADGSVHFLSDGTEQAILGALATRNGNDNIDAGLTRSKRVP